MVEESLAMGKNVKRELCKVGLLLGSNIIYKVGLLLGSSISKNTLNFKYKLTNR